MLQKAYMQRYTIVVEYQTMKANLQVHNICLAAERLHGRWHAMTKRKLRKNLKTSNTSLLRNYHVILLYRTTVPVP